MLVSWRIWIGAVKEQCPYAVDGDPELCSQRICRCKRWKMGEWMKKQYGYYKAERTMGLFERAREARNGNERTKTQP